MHRIIGGTLVLLLAIPALGAEDKPKDTKDTAATPAEQYQALLKEWQEASTVYRAALQKAITPAERRQIVQEKNPQLMFEARFVGLAEKYAKDPIAVDALVWALSNGFGPPRDKGPRTKIIERVAREHIKSDKLGPVCQALASSYEKRYDELLRAIIAGNPHKSVQAEACLALAQSLHQRIDLVKRLADNPKLSKPLENFLGKKAFDELKMTDLTKLQSECDMAFRELADKHITEIKADRLANVCQRLAYSADKGSETFLKVILEKDGRREVQGLACLALAQSLKQRADGVAEKDPKEAAKVRAEGEKLFDRAAANYADVKLPFRGTIGEKARSVLYEIRHLAIGVSAPDIDGEDQDGKKLKLSDFKGKVVLLDFWSQY